MKKRDIEIIITSGLILVFVFIIFRDTKILRAKKSIQKEDPQIEEVALVKIDLKDKKGLETAGGWGRDPFMFGIGVEGLESAGGSLHLNGIVWDEDSPYAIINNEVFKVGDILGQRKVIEITKEEVVLEEEGERFSLKLEQVEF